MRTLVIFVMIFSANRSIICPNSNKFELNLSVRVCTGPTVMLPPRFPVLSALLVLLMAAGRCTAAALRRGSGTRSDGRLVDGRSALDPVSRYPRTRTEAAAVTEHRGKTPERGSRSHHGAGKSWPLDTFLVI